MYSVRPCFGAKLQSGILYLKPYKMDWRLVLNVNFASLLYIVIIYKTHKRLSYNSIRAKQIRQKGSFFSLIILLVLSLLFYFFRIFATGSERHIFLISILIFFWSPVTVLLVCVLNYLPQVKWQTVGETCSTLEWWKTCLSKNSNFFIYWLALLIHFVEITCKTISVMLDVAHEVAPLIQHSFPNESSKYSGLMVILIGIRLAFHTRLLSLIWQKLFHGDKDLFSEPSIRLVTSRMDEVEVQPLAQAEDDNREIFELT